MRVNTNGSQIEQSPQLAKFTDYLLAKSIAMKMNNVLMNAMKVGVDEKYVPPNF